MTITNAPTGPLAPGQGEDGRPIPETNDAPAQAGADTASQPAELSGEAKALADTKAALTKAQQELAELRKKVPASPKAASADDPAATAPDKPKDAVDPNLGITEKQVEAVTQMDFEAERQEFLAKADLPEETRASIAERLKGVLGDSSRAIVDQYVDGAKELKAKMETTVYSYTGGAENYAAMIAWAKDNLSDADKSAYNSAVNSGNLSAIQLAAAGLKSRWESAEGKAPKLVSGGTPAQSSSRFASLDEMRAAIADSRYRSDATYRKSVEAKVLASSF